MTFAAFHDLSLGILLGGASRTITAALTLTQAEGGLPNDLSSVKLAYVDKNKHRYYYIPCSYIHEEFKNEPR